MVYILTLGYLLFAYLLGSLPFSHFFPSKIKGKDVREEGSGNVGATNVLVVAGPWPALLSLFGDIAKGYLAIVGARLIGLTGGILLALDPFLTLVVVLFWLFSFLVVRYFIPATVLIICLLPVLLWLGSWGIEYITFAAVGAVLAVYVHRFDLQWYFSGKDTTIGEALRKFLKQ